MSKYRIEIAPSRALKLALFLLCVLLLVSLWSWQPGILVYQTAWQSLLSLLLILLFYGQYKGFPRHKRVALLDEQGDWQWLDTQQLCVIAPGSRFTSWVLWLELESRLGARKKQWLWIARDSVSDTDYRRICRVIKRVRR